jgi:hypothetical protein
VLDFGFGTYCSCIIALRFTRGTEHWNLAWRVRARATCGLATFLEGTFFGMAFLEYRVSSMESGNFFLVSIVCDCDCGCGSVPSLLRLVYTIDFNELT